METEPTWNVSCSPKFTTSKEKKNIPVHFTIIPRCSKCDSSLSVRQSDIETS